MILNDMNKSEDSTKQALHRRYKQRTQERELTIQLDPQSAMLKTCLNTTFATKLLPATDNHTY